MGEIVFLGLNLDAWITLITVITVLAVLLLTKVRTDAVFLIVTGIAVACLVFPLTPLP